ncbi:histidine phosphatase family protein [Neobacillus kokaensis]|uniref:Histidine phosphatase n=1 Tax=Neobacillus kokaensis TaxID=2759023 RepID=A0ABQ3MVZ1_9BACI|nr:histidine phosphatase family protein [Neobacillus kokaensis]GHH96833.1 histidine phosphatase [Neobacillus kokaensis]
MDDCVVIALFRHGVTEANKRRAYLGWSDSPLCPEAKSLSPKKDYGAYFSSDLARCAETAQFMFPNTSPVYLQEFREMSFGEWEGKTYEDLKDHKLYRHWLSEPFRYNPPNGESFQEFTSRVDAGWKTLTTAIFSKNIHRCAVITHGGVIRYLLTAYAQEVKDFWDWNIPHDAGVELTFSREGLRRGERCILLQEVPLTAKELG